MSETEVVLHRGDCLSVLPTLQGADVGLVFADLPYGVLAADWDVKISLEMIWNLLTTVSKPQAVTVFTATQPFLTDIINSNRKNFRYDIVWAKTKCSNAFHAKTRPMRQHENIAVFSRGLGCYNPQKRPGRVRREVVTQKPSPFNTNRVGTFMYDGTGLRAPTTIIKVDESDVLGTTAARRRLHSSQKPVELLELLIKTYTNEGDTILDPCAGSGTTAIAALNVGNRKVICIEKDPAYFDVMSKRVAEHKEKLSRCDDVLAPPKGKR